MTNPVDTTAPSWAPYASAVALTSQIFPGPVFHYTDQAGFLGIVRDKAIWATDSRYLNDSREYSMGFDRIVAHLSRATEGDQALTALLVNTLQHATPARVIGTCVASFSLVEDDLSQWRAYGAGSGGLALGFDPSTLAQRILLTGSQFGAVRYTESEHLKIVTELSFDIIREARRVLDDAVSKQDFTARCTLSIQLACALMKHEKFHAEREWRMIVWSALPPYVTAHVRPGRSMLVPYVSTRLDTIGSPSGIGFEGRLPLSEVWVGPTPHPELALRSITMALRLSGESATARTSQVPFRNW